MAEQALTAFDDSDLDDVFLAVAFERLDTRAGRATRRRLERNGPLARMARRRAIEKFTESGGDPGDIQSFFDWLIQNWPAILEMLKSLIALFTV